MEACTLETIKCRSCGHEKLRRIRRERTYEDQFGRLWASPRICPACYSLRQIRRRSPQPKNQNTFIGARNETVVAAYLSGLGYVDVVALGGAFRPDVIFTDGAGVRRKVEVKTATESGPKGCGCWAVKAVTPRHRADDFIAIVLPDGRIHFEPMAEHLSKCPPSGRRAVTDLVRKAA